MRSQKEYRQILEKMIKEIKKKIKKITRTRFLKERGLKKVVGFKTILYLIFLEYIIVL